MKKRRMRISSVLCFLCAVLILAAASCKGTEPLLVEATGNKALTSDSIKDKQNQISKAEKEKESLKGSLTDLKKVKKELEKKKKNLASYVAELDNNLSEIEQNISKLKAQITATEEEINDLDRLGCSRALIEGYEGSCGGGELCRYGSRAACNGLCEGKKQEYASRDSGVNDILAKSTEEALNYHDSVKGTDNALPCRNVGAEVERKKKTGYNCGEISNGLLFASDEVENNLGKNCTCNASENDPKSLNSEDDDTCNSRGKHCDNNVTHDIVGGRALLMDMRGGGNMKLTHYLLPPVFSFCAAAYFLRKDFAAQLI